MALAAPAAQGASQQENLQAVRKRIEALTQELDRKEGTQREARDALRDSERAISSVNRRVTQLAVEARTVRAEAARIARSHATLEREISKREAAIARMLVAQAAAGVPDALRVALSGHDPSDIGRHLYYLAHISRAAAELLEEQRSALAELERLASEAKARAERLLEIERASRAERDKLLAERRERRRVLVAVAAEIRKNRKEIRVLRADEARLGRLVAAIGSGVVGGSSFAALRGKLAAPVRGELAVRFGAPRGAAGTEAKGVFIRAPEGQPVRAIAKGQVVYADWMRGFGNLLIVDHGESYLSIYANTESLLKEPGDPVSAGEPIATTGSSGGREETGLYFEMRHLGRAFDPLRWVKLK